MAQYGLTPEGPNPKRLDVILGEMHESLTRRLGVNTRQNPQSLLNHLLTNVADQIAELWEYGSDVYYSQYPATAEGSSLDSAAQFGGSTRETPAKSYYSILCTGLDGTVVPAGTLIAADTNPPISLSLSADAVISRANFNKATVVMAPGEVRASLSVALNGTLYAITPDPDKTPGENLRALQAVITDSSFRVSTAGDALVIEAEDAISSNVMVLSENLTTQTVSSVIQFATIEDGDILIPNGVITKIVKAAAGLTAVVNVGSYIAGRRAETDAEFRRSYADKIFNRSSSMVESIRSAILSNVQGILSCAVYQNDSGVTDSAGRWPHSVEVVVDGGDANEIARQILDTKAGGISSFGSVEVALPGEYGEEITVRFNRPAYVKVWFKVGVTLSRTTNPPVHYIELIKRQILEKMGELGAGDSVIPQNFHLAVSGIDYMDVSLFATTEEGKMPEGYNLRSVSISPRERAVTDAGRIEVVLDG